MCRSRATMRCAFAPDPGRGEWNGAAFSPETNSLFVAAVDWCANVQVKRNIEIPPTGGLFLGSEKPLTDIFDPPDKAKRVAHGV